MSFIASMFQSPQKADIVNPVNKDMTTGAVTQTSQAIGQQNALLNALSGQGGIANQSNILAQQQALANQLQQQAAGGGPNPALAQLNQTTGQNTANQAALMAGQRGSSANAGLIARQAGMQGAANQQNAAGQAATMRANQTLAAQQALAGQQAQMQGVAGNMVGNQLGQAQNVAQNYLGTQNSLLNSLGNQNQAAVANTGQYNQAIGNQQSLGLKAAGALATGGASLGSFAQGGEVKASVPSINHALEHLKAMKFAGGGAIQSKGKSVPALVSPGERYLPPSEVKEVAAGKKSPLKAGEKIPGTPKVKGDSYANDTVSKTLKSGGIVIPNSILQSANPEANAAKFIAAVLAKSNSHKGRK